MNKAVRDGKVAVLYSPGFGAGWSTWADDEYVEFTMFDPGLVALAERRASEEEVKEYIRTTLGEEAYVYTGGWRNICIRWIPVGTVFFIDEYDGSESIKEYSRQDYYTA